MLDPRQFLLPALYLDPATQALLLQSSAQSTSSGGGKMGLHSSFRISDLLQTPTTAKSLPVEQDPSPRTNSSDSLCSPRLTSPCTERSGNVSPSSTLGSKKARKARTIFTDKQLQELETTFEKQKYLSVQDRMELAHRMGLSDTQVKTWYQNRSGDAQRPLFDKNRTPEDVLNCRTKWKRQATSGVDLLSDPGNLVAVQNLIRSNPFWSTYLSSLPMGQMTMPPMGMCLPTTSVPVVVQPTSQCSSPSSPLDVSSTD
ncbi:unnamed protein product [Caenorhabditis auriculariae]|uniref:Homeobox domain-containing protein n=1 Tax=Caenorhabditis auriculariae TaxID=2777116 RepID=A0A8S1GWS0_9PELO|nr:unnamed protein product [Caenorhabditis auriculariae]